MKLNMKLRYVLLFILIVTIYVFGQNTSASINVFHNWTAIQNFLTGSTLSANPAAADRTTKLATTAFIVPGVTTSTSGPVSDPGDTFDFLYNNSSGAITFNAPAGVVGLERCYRNSTGKTGVITIQMAASNTVDFNGTNGSVAGTLVSTGALADGICINSDATNHWYASPTSGTWTNN
jgi:hypothetical protein